VRQCKEPLKFLHIGQLTSGQDSAQSGAFDRFPVGQEYKQCVEVWIYLFHSFIMHLATHRRNTTKVSATPKDGNGR
jgi:hypothetical protein